MNEVTGTPDLILDVLRAADPNRKREALAKLGNHVKEPSFSSAFSKVETAFRPISQSTSSRPSTVDLAPPVSIGASFEAAVLTSLLQSMFPANSSELFGSGIAGSSFKSMLVEQFAKQIASSGSLGIGALLDARQGSSLSRELTHAQRGRTDLG